MLDKVVHREIESFVVQNKNISNNSALKNFEQNLVQRIKATEKSSNIPVTQSVELPKIENAFNSREHFTDLIKSQSNTKSRHKPSNIITLDERKVVEPYCNNSFVHKSQKNFSEKPRDIEINQAFRTSHQNTISAKMKPDLMNRSNYNSAAVGLSSHLRNKRDRHESKMLTTPDETNQKILSEPSDLSSDEWGEVQRYGATLFEREKQEQRLKAHKKKQQVRTILDQQIQLREQLKKQEKQKIVEMD